jgi:hypothetical protein
VPGAWPGTDGRRFAPGLPAQIGFQNIVGNGLDAEPPGIQINVKNPTMKPIHGIVSFFLYPEVCFPDLRVIQEFLAGAFHDNAAVLQGREPIHHSPNSPSI